MKTLIIFIAFIVIVPFRILSEDTGTSNIINDTNNIFDLSIINDSLFIVKSDYDEVFNRDEYKRSYKFLQKYIMEKQELLAMFQQKKELYSSMKNQSMENFNEIQKQLTDYELNKKDCLQKIRNSQKDIYSLNNKITQIKGKNRQKDSLIKVKDSLSAFSKQIFEKLAKYRSDNSNLRESIRDIEADLKGTNEILAKINNSIWIINRDITRAEMALDELAPSIVKEQSMQEFRKMISIWTFVLIAILIAAFFLVIGIKSDKEIIGHLITDIEGLQFITLFVIIIAIILFGILGILEGKELAAIIAAIAGYILGKGSRYINKKDQNQSGTTQTGSGEAEPRTGEERNRDAAKNIQADNQNT